MATRERAGTALSDCLTPLFECFSPTKTDTKRMSRMLGIEREVKVCHNQPHLVLPMKLVFYDEMPSTPRPRNRPASSLFQLVVQGKTLAYKATERASSSIRRRAYSKPEIPAPMPAMSVDDLPLRRYQNGQPKKFRPLELSIYMPENRLSDLPEFIDIDFDAIGEIQTPKKALVRARSDIALKSPRRYEFPARPGSSLTLDDHRLDYRGRERSSSIVSTSRPPSELDALHSHPVVYHTLPGLPPQVHHRHPEQLTILSPMQEEFTPISESHETTTLPFSPTEERPSLCSEGASPNQPIPSDTQTPLRLQRPSTPRRTNHSYSTSATRRVSTWLGRPALHTTRSASFSPSYSQSHETKKSQFYQCAVTPSQPPFESNPSTQHILDHTATASISTVSSSILHGPELASSMMTSMTTAPSVQDLRTKSNTIKSFTEKVRVTVVEIEEEGIPDLPPPEYRDVSEKEQLSPLSQEVMVVPTVVGLAF